MALLWVFMVLWAIFVPGIYIAALFVGYSNGAFLKFNNIDKRIGMNETERFRSKTCISVAIFNSVAHFVVMSFALATIFVALFDNLEGNVVGGILVISVAIYFLINTLYIFCEIRVAGEFVYMYSPRTFFNVVKIPVSDVNEFHSVALHGQTWIKFKVSKRQFIFRGIVNGNEFIDALNHLKRGGCE